MNRIALSFLAGALVALAVLYAIARTPHGGRDLILAVASHRRPLVGRRLPGPGSGIRVVGGSVTVELSGLKFSQESATNLSVENADSTAFALTNVSTDPQSPTGMTVICPTANCQLPAGSWAINEFVQDPNHGVTITGYGSRPSTVKFTTTSGDSFGKGFLFIGLLLNHRYYYDNNEKCTDVDQCETVDHFTVGGVTWYCKDPNGQCNVYIGN